MNQSLPFDKLAMRTIPELLKAQAEQHADKLFVKIGVNQLTYSQMDQCTDQMALGLSQLGVSRGDRVALMMENRIEYLVSFFALSKIGAITVPVNVYLKGSFLSYQLKNCSASLVITDEKGVATVLSLLEDLPELTTIVSVDPIASQAAITIVEYESVVASEGELSAVTLHRSETMAISYTSGTTGMPKGCILSHGYYTGIPRLHYENNWFRPDDILYTAFPLYHIAGGLLTLMDALYGGLSIHYATSFSASHFMEETRQANATVVWGVGAMGLAILATPETENDLNDKLRMAIWIPMQTSQQEQFRNRFGPRVVSNAYGQTEMCSITSVDTLKTNDATIAGYATSAVEMKLVDDYDMDVATGEVGEIVIRTTEPDMMFGGYWNNPAATVAAFRNLWHHTGDCASMDDRGAITFVDRKKDAIRRRGVNISSMQLEAGILNHEDIIAVAVHAVPSPLGEDDIKACIVLNDGATLDHESMYSFFKKQLPYYAIPRYLEVLTELPINAMGRVMKHQLRDKGVGAAQDLEALSLSPNKSERR